MDKAEELSLRVCAKIRCEELGVRVGARPREDDVSVFTYGFLAGYEHRSKNPPTPRPPKGKSKSGMRNQVMSEEYVSIVDCSPVDRLAAVSLLRFLAKVVEGCESNLERQTRTTLATLGIHITVKEPETK